MAGKISANSNTTKYNPTRTKRKPIPTTPSTNHAIKPLSFSYPERRGPNRPTNSLESHTKNSKPSHSRAHYVFVYGTLKKGFANAHLLDRATYLGDFRTVTRYPLVVGGKFNSPYLLDMPQQGENVKGEVYAVDDAILADLDHLENVGVNYSRKIDKVSSATDRAFVVDAFVYFKVNGMSDLAKGTYLEDYQCKKYVPRHLRPSIDIKTKTKQTVSSSRR